MDSEPLPVSDTGSLPEGWAWDGNAITRRYTFKDFTSAFAFMSRVAGIANTMEHHPDWTNVYNVVSVRLSTHSTGTVTSRDLELAAAMNGVYEP